ncbi:MAG: ribosome assembly RNA-binding protein YhbY [bacterium]
MDRYFWDQALAPRFLLTPPALSGIHRVAMYTETGKQRRHLRALAHPLKPVVQVGVRGLVESVLEQVEAQLHSHELIKIKLGEECPIDPAEVRDAIAQTLRAEVVQIIGRTLIAYRPRKKNPTIELP